MRKNNIKPFLKAYYNKLNIIYIKVKKVYN